MPSSIVLAVIGVTLETMSVAALAAYFAASYIITKALVGKPKAQSNSVRQQVPPSTDNRIPVVYGDAWLGGSFVDAVLSSDQQTMYYVMAISHISPDGQFSYDTTKFYYGDRLVTFGTGAAVASLTDDAGNVDTKIAGSLEINLYTSSASGVITTVRGSAPNVVMGGADIDAALRWPASGRQMNGLAFAIIKLKFNTDAGTTGLQPVTFKVSHVQGATGISKPGWVLKDYLSNDVYGGAVPLSNINTTACDALDTYSDQTITYTPSGGGSATQARYRINGVLDTGETVLNNIDHILTACDSWLSYQAETGQWAPIINKAESSSFSFNDSNIIGDIRVSATDITQSINQVEVSFPFKGNKDQPGTVLIETPSGLLYPNEPVNKYTTTFNLVNDSVQAQYLANRMLEQAREDLIVSFSTAYTGIQVNAGEVVSVTNSSYGWTNKLFRVMKVTETSLPDGNLGARFELNEYNAQVYDDASITQFSPAPNSGIASGYYFPTLTAPTFSDQAPSATPPTFSASCLLPTTARVTAVTLYYTTNSTPTQSDWKVWAIQTGSNNTAFTAGSSLKFPNITLASGTYYFAFSVSNDVSTSQLSTMSSAFAWSPVGVGQISAYWSPSSIQVSRTDGTPNFSGIAYQLYLTESFSPVNFVASQTDADAAFVNNTWRIGASSSTGYASISTTNGLVVGNPTDGGNYASFAAPSAMTGTPALLTVPVRYKDNSGNISQVTVSNLQFIFVDSGAQGPAGATGAQARIMFARVPGNPTPSAGIVTVTGDAKPTGAQSSAVWGSAFNVIWYDSDPNPSSSDSLYQSDGIYNNTNTSWSAPYVSALKVGTLSAITVNTGALTVQDALTVSTSGIIKSGKTTYGSGTGWLLEYNSGTPRLDIGGSDAYMRWNGSSLEIKNGTVVGQLAQPSMTVGLGPSGGTITVYDSIDLVYGNVTAVASGGQSPYTYSWTLDSFSIVGATRISNITGNVAEVSGSQPLNTSKEVAITCIATDANGRTASATAIFDIVYGTPP